MNELMIITFGLAVVRTLTPLMDKEKINFSSLFMASTMCWAFYHLLSECATITIQF